MSDPQLSLFDDAPERREVPPPLTEAPPPAAIADDPDSAARRFAVDPNNHVVLEASAGTGKTSVLVQRYINLLKAGIEPANILAITFTRKAAAEMRERIVRDLRDAAARSEIDRTRWLQLRDRLGEIAISTIDAFCLSLLREFPLEADLDPAFDMADETEVPRLIDESLDRSLRMFIRLAPSDPEVALVLAQLGTARTRAGLAALLARRLVAWDALNRFLVRGPADLTAARVCRRASVALQDVLRTAPGGLRQFLNDGPVHHPRFQLLAAEFERLNHADALSDAAVRSALERVAAHFLTQDRKPRKGGNLPPYRAEHYASTDASKRHRSSVAQLAPAVLNVLEEFDRDLNVILSRGIRRMFGIALSHYRESLDKRAVLDFPDVLEGALKLLRQMDEFSQSRFRLEKRYHHVLVDEFQDTSRAQWELVSLLIQSWGEGAGLASQPSIFIVGDRKQSIYRFRDAEVAVLDDAGTYIEALRPGGSPRRAISRSFRAVPELLAFVNDLFAEVVQPTAGRKDDFRYGEADRFPVELTPDVRRGPVLGLNVGDEPEQCAAAVAAEIARILEEDSVRDRKTGVPRRARPGDIGILFRSRVSHREFERALEALGLPTYVYKGLGFFDADEIKDVSALMRYLANPDSDLRAAAFLRSRFIRLSDAGLAALAPGLASALNGAMPDAALADEDARVLQHARRFVAETLPLVDRVPPADLIEELLPATAYAYELRGPRRLQAWENVKKMRGLVRRIQNRGYATLGRIADYIDALSAGDESNAAIEALDAVNLMTVHASKGLEFPIVFVVNMAKGASGPPQPMRVIADGFDGEPAVSVGPFASDADALERLREKQETRRLLYVAATRARDRLYFSSVLKNGKFAPGPGSLGEVLPESICRLFENAAATLPECATIAWAGQSGHTFEWRLVRNVSAPVATEAAVANAGRPFAADVPRTGGRQRGSVTQLVESGADAAATAPADAEALVTGRLVHRLFQFAHLAPAEPAALASFARRLLRPDERASVVDVTEVVSGAVAAWRAASARPDVAALLSGTTHYEVPFSLTHLDGAIVRGTIDCLVERPDGTLVVVEFKTGRAVAAHEQQLAVYVEAARALFPGRLTRGTLVYS